MPLALIERALEVTRDTVSAKPAEHALVTGFASRLAEVKALDSAERSALVSGAADAVEKIIYPAYARAAAALEASKPAAAQSGAGVGAGEAAGGGAGVAGAGAGVGAPLGAPGTPPAPAAVAAADPEKPVYETLIHPIFASRCIGCHGEEKTKGKLKMHTFEALMKNGDSGEATIVPGKSAESLIIKRAALPLEEDEHMPPSNKDQLSEKEVAILKWWIDGGAKTDVKLKDSGLPDNLK
jgi:hypothetical protein